MGISTLTKPATMTPAEYVNEVLFTVRRKNPAEPEFHQAVEEVLESLTPALEKHPEYQKAKILERLVEPERVIMFRVPWFDDAGQHPGQSRFPH